jgi:hypothetical protein
VAAARVLDVLVLVFAGPVIGRARTSRKVVSPLDDLARDLTHGSTVYRRKCRHFSLYGFESDRLGNCVLSHQHGKPPKLTVGVDELGCKGRECPEGRVPCGSVEELLRKLEEALGQ